VKRTLLTGCFGLLLASLLFSQAPQGFSYQAVATDNDGDELVESLIGLRLAIRQGTPAGTAQWIETHQVTTDPFGLFTLTVGLGDPAGGAAPSFAAIDWTNGPFFLEVALDASGGSSYSPVGTTQLLSVPFALHADRSTRATLADSAVVAGQATQALQATTAIYADSAGLAGQATQALQAETAAYADSAGLAGQATQALLADHALTADTSVYAQMANFSVAAIYADQALEEVGDEDRDATNELQELSFADDTLRISAGNFITLTSQSTFYAPGASLDFPQGLAGDGYVFMPDQFTVPPNKNFYIVAAEDVIRFPQYGAAFGNTFTGPNWPVVPEGTLIDNCRCVGFLIDETININPLIITLQPNGASEFTVPNGRYFVIKSGLDATVGLTFNNIPVNFFNGPTPHIVVPGGITLRITTDDEAILTGYLND
jgi:hypothetical protein